MFARALLCMPLLAWFAGCSGCDDGTREPLPKADTLRVVVTPDTPWIVRVGDTFTAHIAITTPDGRPVPEADVQIFEGSSIRYTNGVAATMYSVTKSGAAVAGFDVAITPHSVPREHTTTLAGTLTVGTSADVDASVTPLTLPNLVIYGGDADRVDVPTSVTRMVIGETRPMTAITSATAEEGFADLVHSDDAATWTSSNPGVATVTSAGLVQGVSAGTATLTASARGHQATMTVEVSAGTLGPPPDGETVMTERSVGQDPLFIWPIPVGSQDVLVDILASDDQTLQQLATDSRGYPFLVGSANANRGDRPWHYDSDQLLLAEWTGSGVGFTRVGEPWESATAARVFVDERDQLYVVYTSNVAGVRIAQRDAKRPDLPFTYRTASWMPDSFVTDHVEAIKLEAPYNRPYGLTVTARPGGGIYVGMVLLTDGSVIASSGCLETVQVFSVTDAMIARTEARQAAWPSTGIERHCSALSPLPTGGGSTIQVLRPLAGETWPRFLYTPAESQDGVLEYKVVAGQWTSAPVVVAPGVGEDPKGPVMPARTAMLAQTSEAGDPEIAMMVAPNALSGYDVARMVRRLADGSWQVMMGPPDPLACAGDDGLVTMCGGSCQFNPATNQTACYGSMFNPTDAPLMPEGFQTPALGIVNGRLLFTSGHNDTVAYVVSRTGGTRRDVFQDLRGRAPDDVLATPLENTQWLFAKGRVLFTSDTFGSPTKLSVLTAVTQPRATPRYADSIAAAQRMGDRAIPDSVEAQPTVDSTGRVWVHGTTYAGAGGVLFATDAAQTRFTRLTTTPPTAGFMRPQSILFAGGKTIVPDIGRFWMSSDGGQTFTQQLAVNGDSFLPTTQLVLPGGQYFGVEVHSPTTFVRRYSSNLPGLQPLTTIADPEWNSGNYLRAGDDAAVLLSGPSNTVWLLSAQKNSTTLGGPNTYVVVETFASDGSRTSRVPIEWVENREPALLTSVVLDATHVGMFEYPASGDTDALFVSVDVTTGTRVEHVIATGDAWPRRIVKLTGGQLAAGWTERYADGRALAMVAFSTDQGATWGAPVPVWPGGAPKQVMSSLTPLADGSVLVIFGDRGILDHTAPRLWPEVYVNELKAFPMDFNARRIAP